MARAALFEGARFLLFGAEPGALRLSVGAALAALGFFPFEGSCFLFVVRFDETMTSPPYLKRRRDGARFALLTGGPMRSASIQLG